MGDSRNTIDYSLPVPLISAAEPTQISYAKRDHPTLLGSVARAVARALLRPVYLAYEHWLCRQIRDQPLPNHVGIILDGNRRHARKHRENDPGQIYALGAMKLDDVLDWCGEMHIPAVTLWAVSTDNLNRRPASEVSNILAAVEAKLAALVQDPRIHRHRVRVRAAGRLDLLPESTTAAIRSAEAATAEYVDGLALTVAVAYGGHDEIVDAVRALLGEVAAENKTLGEAIEAITPAAINRHLYMAGLPDPDLIIRTSGEIRLSGFLLWQSAYSELYFTDVDWPAFRKIDFLRAVRAFQQRRRRFGH